MTQEPVAPLPLENLADLDSIGHALHSSAWLYQPKHVDELKDLLAQARKHGLSVNLRGAGRSYGDAALNGGQIVLDMQLLNRITHWDAGTGHITAEPGVTIEQLWKHVITDGYWSPVVPGTMFPTLGGCLAANVHGKNNWRAGTIGEHVVEFEALLANGKRVVCSPRKNKDLFYAMISGMGLLGVFTSITLQLKPIESGNLEVSAWAEPNLAGMLKAVDDHKEDDYIVGWIDCYASGRSAGRGQIHAARYLSAAEDPDAERSLTLDYQVLPDRLFGVLPAKLLPTLMLPFSNNFGTWGVNTAKYLANATIGNHTKAKQSLVAFSFLLDYYPIANFGGKGFIQYQSFLPKETAHDAYLEMLKLCKRAGMPSYAGVLKRHRPDDFLFSHAVDGYSMAMDFRVTPASRPRLVTLAAELDKLALAAGGRFYFAKDSTLTRDKVAAYLGAKTVKQFKQLKAQYDPENLLQSELYRRCF